MTRKDTDEVTLIARRYREVRREYRWYKNELLDMVEDGEQGTETWEDYRERLKELGQELMRLARNLPEGVRNGNVEVCENAGE